MEPCTILLLIRSLKLVGEILNRRCTSRAHGARRFCGLAILQYIFEWLQPLGHGATTATFSTHVAEERTTLPKVYAVFNYHWLKTAPSSLYNLSASWIPSGGGTSGLRTHVPDRLISIMENIVLSTSPEGLRCHIGLVIVQKMQKWHAALGWDASAQSQVSPRGN